MVYHKALLLDHYYDMPLVSNFNTKLFADDTVPTLTNSYPKLLNKNINSELVKINKWLKLDKLSLNTNKTKFYGINQTKISLALWYWDRKNKYRTSK